MTVLMTIGYEGATQEDFVAALRAAQVSILLDVREAPVSRRPGFSKRDLAAAVEAAGIAYLHLRGLGNPKPGRDAAKVGDTDTYLRIFNDHMKSEVARSDLRRAASYARRGGACLMCYERDHRRCHRDIVAAALAAETGVAVCRLEVGQSRDGRQMTLGL
jgi:uncharacterized protein (DUF488 family)